MSFPQQLTCYQEKARILKASWSSEIVSTEFKIENGEIIDILFNFIHEFTISDFQIFNSSDLNYLAFL
jgi:hypothetical protein